MASHAITPKTRRRRLPKIPLTEGQEAVLAAWWPRVRPWAQWAAYVALWAFLSFVVIPRVPTEVTAILVGLGAGLVLGLYLGDRRAKRIHAANSKAWADHARQMEDIFGSFGREVREVKDVEARP